MADELVGGRSSNWIFLPWQYNQWRSSFNVLQLDPFFKTCQNISYESQSRVVKCHPELEYSTLEEADVRIMPHLIHCADMGHAGSVLLSSDTDVLVLAMYHWKVFKMHGLQV